jgi:ParB family chromosome partitioning protein
MSRKTLGKGLAALIPEAALEEVTAFGSDERVQDIRVDEIRPNPFQPRKDFDKEGLAELAESIRSCGIIQPVVVRKASPGYELVVGERRWLAAQMVQLSHIPAVVMELSDVDATKYALVENLQRRDLNPIEEAEAYNRLMKEHKLTQEEIAEAVGKSRSTVANTLRLLSLPLDIRESVSRGTISMGHARALLGVDEPVAQRKIWQRVIEKELSVRETEKMIQLWRKGLESEEKSKKREVSPEIIRIEDALQKAFGTKVRIKHGKRGGKIELEYYGLDDLERLLGLLYHDGIRQ